MRWPESWIPLSPDTSPSQRITWAHERSMRDTVSDDGTARCSRLPALERELVAIRFLNARIEIEFESDAAGFINHRVPLRALTEVFRREFGHHAWPFRNAREELV